MAPATGTPYQVRITSQDTGLWKVRQTEEAAQKTSELLQKDNEEHHVFFNNEGFHNHIPHHLLALFGTGAPATAIQKAYDDNAGYQRPALSPHERVIQDLETWDHARKYLGKEQYYPDFLRFFQKEIERKGWENVLNEYLFKGDDIADELFARLFAGFLHPLIQLMYGMEWAQPVIVAEALAQTSVHDGRLNPFLLEAEKQAREEASDEDMPSILSLYEAVRADKTLATAARNEDANKIRDGVLARGRDAALALLRRVRVRADELDARTAEMFNASAFVAAVGAFHPPKVPKVDFFLMHHVNASPIFLTINAQPWISTETKVRILEWKIRLDLIQYAARACPPLDPEPIKSYKPKDPSGKTPLDVISRLYFLHDDGHAIKLARALGICQQVSKKYEDQRPLPIKGDDYWMKIFHLVVDASEAPGQRWVRTAGLEEAWKDIPDAKL
ncbi:hypothetical protein VTK73DRAFT_7380 [Phialemonium thermophilum]|uniref:HypA protein n=1 Tax=Phialemonium thermophilum TaxID=223376 RepID=A0ABR3WEP2_9PEZI